MRGATRTGAATAALHTHQIHMKGELSSQHVLVGRQASSGRPWKDWAENRSQGPHRAAALRTHERRFTYLQATARRATEAAGARRVSMVGGSSGRSQLQDVLLSIQMALFVSSAVGDWLWRGVQLA
jgi:hypothetical protein